MIDAILFDMDGVLIDAREWHYESLNRALSHFGMGIDRQAHISTFDGLPTRRKLEILSSSRGLPEGLADLINRLKQDYTMEMIYSRCRPVFHHQYALSRLRREGYKLAVCSNSIRSTVEAMMRLSNLAGHLDMIVSNEDVSRAKPDPEMYKLAMLRFGLAPDKCLIIEDNEHGVQAAKMSGAHVMRVVSPGEVQYDRIMTEVRRLEMEAA